MSLSSAAVQKLVPEIVDTGDRGAAGTFRTNLGLNNLGPEEARVRLELVGSGGNILGATTVQVPSNGLKQIDNVARVILGAGWCYRRAGLHSSAFQPADARLGQQDRQWNRRSEHRDGNTVKLENAFSPLRSAEGGDEEGVFHLICPPTRTWRGLLKASIPFGKEGQRRIMRQAADAAATIGSRPRKALFRLPACHQSYFIP